MTITEFLLARIAEDEDRARDFEQDHALAINGSYSNWDACYGAPAEWKTLKRLGFLPARVLAECAAKRAIVAMAPNDDGYVKCGDWESCSDSCPAVIAEYAIKALAAVYADHPDFREEWKL